ncbi:hypothetical protein DITRI_Ditri09bG0133800 [Diplodiscus trichospermus]
MKVYEQEEGYMTPRRDIKTAAPPCPPAPRKKQPVYMKREPPKNGFFQPPDLDAFFSIVVPTSKEGSLRLQRKKWLNLNGVMP